MRASQKKGGFSKRSLAFANVSERFANASEHRRARANSARNIPDSSWVMIPHAHTVRPVGKRCAEWPVPNRRAYPRTRMHIRRLS